jgi:hypothetical protein
MKNRMIEDFNDGVRGNLFSPRDATSALDGSIASTLLVKLHL